LEKGRKEGRGKKQRPFLKNIKTIKDIFYQFLDQIVLE